MNIKSNGELPINIAKKPMPVMGKNHIYEISIKE
jgi:hypothetical protein